MKTTLKKHFKTGKEKMNKDAAKIIEKILMYPKLVTPKELKTFDTLITEFVVTDIIRKGQQEATIAYFEDYEEANNEQEQKRP